MFDSLLAELFKGAQGVQERPEGVAFFRVAKTTYPLSSLAYIGLNIPIGPQSKRYMQCTYSDRWVKHCVSLDPVSIDRLAGLASALREPVDWSTPERRPPGTGLGPPCLQDAGEPQQLLTLPLRALHSEMALFCISANMTAATWQTQKPILLRDFQVLANYFHQHILRIYGHNADEAILVSARELDCLKWMAAGKTAWEASIILGISERTVRFHLNAAREKLNCITTTQAVAKAISQQLIVI